MYSARLDLEFFCGVRACVMPLGVHVTSSVLVNRKEAASKLPIPDQIVTNSATFRSIVAEVVKLWSLTNTQIVAENVSFWSFHIQMF
jgi:hypothetical protein